MYAVSIMRSGIFCALLVLVGWQFNVASASAASLSASGQITITARVAPTHYIIVDDSDEIIELVSNTSGPAEIEVFRGSVKLGNQINLNPKIETRYRVILDAQHLRMGVLYRKQPDNRLSYTIWQRVFRPVAATSMNNLVAGF